MTSISSVQIRFSWASDPMSDQKTTSDTRERILDVAERLFMENGYEATSMRTITSEAEENLASVNYHFGSKEALVCEVFRRRLGVQPQLDLAHVKHGTEPADEPPELLLARHLLGIVELAADSPPRLKKRDLVTATVQRDGG